MARDKKRSGGFYDDSRGLRYLPLSLYIKLEDFSGGLRYVNWFQKNFPDDICYPDFLFEWTIILFKTGKLRESERKAFQTYCSNTYLFEKYFNRTIIPLDKYEYSNCDLPAYCEQFVYSSMVTNLSDFSEWLSNYLDTEKFKALSARFLEASKRLKTENDRETRGYLLKHIYQLQKELC